MAFVQTTGRVFATPTLPYTQTSDIIYGRKYGMALTMDVFRPTQNANGAGVAWMVSGGFYSNHGAINDEIPGKLIAALAERGYTVFAVVHGCQPKFNILDIVEDIKRAVSFIRYHAADYGIDPDRIGMSGISSGGYLSLMQGLTGNDGDPNSPDPVERTSNRVQALGCFCPPTDFLNYGEPGENALGRGLLKDYAAPFAFQEAVPTINQFKLVPITDETKLKQIGWQISPINHVSSGAPPILIIHGDADPLVPFQQAEIMIAALQRSNVPNRLIVKPGAAHVWDEMEADMQSIADWFDVRLKEK